MSGEALDSGHTAYMWTAMALVQLMTPGLAFFYGGMVSKGNVLAIVMQSYVSMAVVSIVWFTVAFSLTFGESYRGLIGNPFTFLNLEGTGINTPLMRSGAVVSPSIPGLLYAGYQLMFAIITPPLMTGAFADRFRFKPYIIFISLWILVVYAPVGHQLWGGGWAVQHGVMDWAGGIEVHQLSGFSALASLIFVGRRVPVQVAASNGSAHGSEPHNVPFVALGTALLWFGWFGFNGGSSYLSNGPGILATMNTQLAAAAAGASWLLVDLFAAGTKPSLVGFCVGAVVGLVVITPAAGYIRPTNAVFLGFLGSPWCWGWVQVSKKFNRLGMEDALDVWGTHGMGGFLGTIMVGVLADGPECADADTAPIECANPGLVTRSTLQFGKQLAAACGFAAYAMVMTYFLLKIISCFMPIVVPPKQQAALDEAEHGETAYMLEPEARATFGVLPL